MPEIQFKLYTSCGYNSAMYINGIEQRPIGAASIYIKVHSSGIQLRWSVLERM